MARQRERARRRKVASFAAGLSRGTRTGADNEQRIATLCHAMFTYFGGVERFFQTWHDMLEEARRTRPCSTILGHTYISIARLMMHLDACQSGQEGLGK